MFQLPSPWRAVALALLTTLLVAACGRQPIRSLAPESSAIALDRTAAPNAAENQLPAATILTPTPTSLFTTVANAPLRIEWSGDDPEGRLKEYRYRLFSQFNPDGPFPQYHGGDFLAYLTSNPQGVLSFYEANKFEGWGRIAVRKDMPPPSVTYSTLLRNRLYAFVVVAIDQRGAHDVTLTRDRNVLQFDLAPRFESPSMTFRSAWGEVTAANESDFPPTLDVPTSEPVTITWSATPLPGTSIEGYRSMFDFGDGILQPTSLSDVSAIVSPTNQVVGGPSGQILVEVQFDGGKRALYELVVNFRGSAPTGTAAVSR